MTDFFSRNAKKLIVIGVLISATFLLTGCRGGEWQTRPYTSWADEFQLSGFFGVLFGWPLAILSFPFAWLLNFVGGLVGGSFFIAIVLTTIIIRTVAWPVYTKNNNTQLKMQLIQPEIQALKVKYANRTDPESRRREQMETANIYKKHNVNPLGCIATMFIQMPIFIVMFEVLRRVNINTYQYIDNSVIEIVRQGRFAFDSQNFLWFDLNMSFNFMSPIQDIRIASQNGMLSSVLFTIVIGLLVGALNYYQQKRSMAKVEERKKKNNKTYGGREQIVENPQAQQMKWMTVILPLVQIPMVWSNVALGVYMLVGGIYSIVQNEIGARVNDKKLAELKKQK